MTRQNSLKRLVRARMADTGQSYTSARRIVLSQLSGEQFGGVVADGFLHLPGIHPDCTALRVLLANSGVAAPHTGEPPSEALVFGIAGGAGAGAMAFRYEREDLSSFYVTGWNPFQSDVRDACKRLGTHATVSETTGARTAAAQLDELLGEGVPAMAWVDLAELGYAALPAEFSGGAYHTVVVYRRDQHGGGALLGDRASRPVEVPAERLAAARARIRKHRNRLLSLGSAELEADVPGAVRSGLHAAADGPASPPTSAMTLEGVRAWAERVHGAAAKDSWARMFPPGRHLFGALRSVYEYVERSGTGGGLMRPMFAAFLREAAVLLGEPGSTAWRSATTRSARRGRSWPGPPCPPRCRCSARPASCSTAARRPSPRWVARPARSWAASGRGSASWPSRPTTTSRSTRAPSTSSSAGCGAACWPSTRPRWRRGTPCGGSSPDARRCRPSATGRGSKARVVSAAACVIC